MSWERTVILSHNANTFIHSVTPVANLVQPVHILAGWEETLYTVENIRNITKESSGSKQEATRQQHKDATQVLWYLKSSVLGLNFMCWD